MRLVALFVLLVVFCSLVRALFASSPCSRSIGLDARPGSISSNPQVFKCESGSLRWSYPSRSMNVSFRPTRPTRSCKRVICFNVPFPGVQMTTQDAGDIVFNETFTTSRRYNSSDPPPQPRCIESSGRFDVTVLANPSINAYQWNLLFTTGKCAECEKCKADTLTGRLQHPSVVAALVVIKSINRTGDKLEVVLSPKEFLGRKPENFLSNITTFRILSTTDSCNKMVMARRTYGLVYTPFGDSEFTFCARDRVKSVYRALKKARKAGRTQAPTIQTLDAFTSQTTAHPGTNWTTAHSGTSQTAAHPGTNQTTAHPGISQETAHPGTTNQATDSATTLPMLTRNNQTMQQTTSDIANTIESPTAVSY